LPRRLRRNHESASSSLVIHNVVVGSHRTSVRLEPVMWDALRDIATRHRVTLHNLVTDIDHERTASSLTAAIRVYIVDFYRAAALQAAQVQLRAIGPSRLPIRPN
jgi:predicted DNA-binding ribbon-helix-helix protein